MKVQLDLSSNHATKANFKNATGVDMSDFAKKTDLANLKSDVGTLDIDKLKNISSNLSYLKSKVDKLDIGKLETIAVDLSKVSDVVKNDVVKKDSLNAEKNKVKNKIPNVTNWGATTAFTAVENKIPDHS